MMGVFQTFFEQLNALIKSTGTWCFHRHAYPQLSIIGFFVFTQLLKQLLCQFHPCYLVLSRHLAFTALPRMEVVAVEFAHSFLVAT